MNAVALVLLAASETTPTCADGEYVQFDQAATIAAGAPTGGACTDCPRGKFTFSAASLSCSPCAMGRTTNSSKSTSASDCNVRIPIAKVLSTGKAVTTEIAAPGAGGLHCGGIRCSLYRLNMQGAPEVTIAPTVLTVSLNVSTASLVHVDSLLRPLPGPIPGKLSVPAASLDGYMITVSNPTAATVEITTSYDACNYVRMWSGWGVCSATCGFGTHKRTRRVLHGTGCTDLSETRACDSGFSCPPVCKYSEWGGWGACSATCSQFGAAAPERSRFRKLISGDASKCIHVSEFSTCNTDACAQDCVVGTMQVSNCTTLCGSTGVQWHRFPILQKNDAKGAPCPINYSLPCNRVSCTRVIVTDLSYANSGKWVLVAVCVILVGHATASIK